MDKEEFRIKLEEINNLVEKKDYEGAMKVVDSIDWRRVKNVRTLCIVGEIYAANKRYEDSREIFLLAYHRAPIGKNILYRLIEISLKMGDIQEADEYYQEYMEVASDDNAHLLLQYKIQCAKDAPLEDQIKTLEEYKEQEFTERWSYELAKLYYRAGQKDKCLDLCNEMSLWFNEGSYVLKALDLKKKISGLSSREQELYDREYAIKKDKNQILQSDSDQIDAENDGPEANQSEETEGDQVSIGSINLKNEKDLAGVESLQDKISKGIRDIFGSRKEEEKDPEDQSPESIPEEIIVSADQEKEIPEPDDVPVLENETEKGTGVVSPEPVPEVVPAPVERVKKADKKEPARVKEFKIPESIQRFSIHNTNIFPDIKRNRIQEENKADSKKEDKDGEFNLEDTILAAASLQGIEIPDSGADKRKKKKDGRNSEVTEDSLSDQNPEENMYPEGDAEADEELYPEENGTEADEDGYPDEDSTKPDEDEYPEEDGTEPDEDEYPEEDGTEPDEDEYPEEDGTEPDEDEYPEEDGTDKDVYPEEDETESDEDGYPEEDETESDEDVYPEGDGTEPDEDEYDSYESEYVPSLEEEEFLSEEDLASAEEEFLNGPSRRTKEDSYDYYEEPENDRELTDDEKFAELLKQSMQEEDEINRPDPGLNSTIFSDESNNILKPASVSDDSDIYAESEVSLQTKDPLDIIPRAHELDEEEEKLFTYFTRVPGMKEQLIEMLEDVQEAASDKTSVSGNIIVMGGRESGKTRLISGIIPAICRELHLPASKVAYVFAEDINGKDISRVVDRLAGGFLVIEDANQLTQKTVDQLDKAMEMRTDGLIVILEDEKIGMRKMIARYPRFARKFTSMINIPVFTNDELVTFAIRYTMENGYKIDRMGMLALYNKIGENQKEDEPMSIGSVKNLLDVAIAKAEGGLLKFNRKKRVDRDGYITLHEKDFL